MKTSVVTKLSIAVAATMLTLTPALAHGKSSSSKHGYGYSHSYSKKAYGKPKFSRHYKKPRRHAHRRHWRSRYLNPWRYHGYRR